MQIDRDEQTIVNKIVVCRYALKFNIRLQVGLFVVAFCTDAVSGRHVTRHVIQQLDGRHVIAEILLAWVGHCSLPDSECHADTDRESVRPSKRTADRQRRATHSCASSLLN